jgi:hypothetical protein
MLKKRSMQKGNARRPHIVRTCSLSLGQGNEKREKTKKTKKRGARSVDKGNVRRSYSFPIISERRRDREAGEETEQGVCRKETHENDEREREAVEEKTTTNMKKRSKWYVERKQTHSERRREREAGEEEEEE